MYGILEKEALLHEPYFLNTLLLFFLVAAYLCYKEIILLVTQKDYWVRLLKNRH